MKAVFLFFMLAVSINHGAGTSQTVRDVEKILAEMNTLSANFRQEFYNAAMGDTEISYGTVVLKKPLLINWHYTRPEEQIIVSDGERIYLYVPKEMQVMVEALGGILGSRSPALFLAGGKRLTELFHIELEPERNKDKINSVAVLNLVPKQKTVNITRIVLRVGMNDRLIRSFTVHDWTGNKTRIVFSHTKVNNEIDERIFRFKTPPGVEEVEIPKTGFGVE
jgi:outer membrane lipoprotein carrier protein